MRGADADGYGPLYASARAKGTGDDLASALAQVGTDQTVSFTDLEREIGHRAADKVDKMAEGDQNEQMRHSDTEQGRVVDFSNSSYSTKEAKGSLADLDLDMDMGGGKCCCWKNPRGGYMNCGWKGERHAKGLFSLGFASGSILPNTCTGEWVPTCGLYECEETNCKAVATTPEPVRNMVCTCNWGSVLWSRSVGEVSGRDGGTVFCDSNHCEHLRPTKEQLDDMGLGLFGCSLGCRILS